MPKVLIDAGATTTLVSGVAGRKIRVLQCVLDINNGNATWYFKDSGGNQPIGNLYLESDGGPIILPYSPIGWFETAAGDDLILFLSSGSAGIGGVLDYDLV